MKNKIFNYIYEQYGTQPDFLWESLPSACAFRHRGTKKWFAAWMSVKSETLGLHGKEAVDILDVKNDPILIPGLIDGNGILPGYHMNKQHWLTILLDGSVPFETICSLVDISFNLTKLKTKKRKENE